MVLLARPATEGVDTIVLLLGRLLAFAPVHLPVGLARVLAQPQLALRAVVVPPLRRVSCVLGAAHP